MFEAYSICSSGVGLFALGATPSCTEGGPVVPSAQVMVHARINRNRDVMLLGQRGRRRQIAIGWPMLHKLRSGALPLPPTDNLNSSRAKDASFTQSLPL